MMGRRIYACSTISLWIVVLLVAGVGPNFVQALDPNGPYAVSLMWVAILGTTVMTSARLVDAGYRWWLGILWIFVLLYGGPQAIFGVVLLMTHWGFVPSRGLVLAVPIPWLIALLAFLAWAGTRRSVALPKLLPEQVFGDGSAPRL
jgi:hypothetical protein